MDSHTHIKFELRCPKCNSRTIQTRIRTGDRVCRRCGYIGKAEEFEVKSNNN